MLETVLVTFFVTWLRSLAFIQLPSAQDNAME